jgi:hypothetical protein
MHYKRAVLSHVGGATTDVLYRGWVQGCAVAATIDLRADIERDLLRCGQRHPDNSVFWWCEVEVVDAGAKAGWGVACLS